MRAGARIIPEEGMQEMMLTWSVPDGRLSGKRTGSGTRL
jgi:hypothetical protein